MPATAEETEDFLNDIAAEIGDFPAGQDDIDRLFDRAAVVYPDSTAATFTYAKILAVRQLKVKAIKRVDYKQNDSEEKLSQLRAGFNDMLKELKEELAGVLTEEEVLPYVRSGSLRRSPTWIVDLPDA